MFFIDNFAGKAIEARLFEEHGNTFVVPGANLRTVGTVRDGEKWPKRDGRKAPQKTDLIIFDVRMPGIDGIETVQNIRNYLKGANKDPVPEILITGYADKDKYEEHFGPLLTSRRRNSRHNGRHPKILFSAPGPGRKNKHRPPPRRFYRCRHWQKSAAQPEKKNRYRSPASVKLLWNWIGLFDFAEFGSDFELKNLKQRCFAWLSIGPPGRSKKNMILV